MQSIIRSFCEAYQAQQYTFHVPLHENFPFSWYRMMRAEVPVYYDESLQAWSLFLYEDVKEALINSRTFSSRMTLEEEPSETVSLSRTDPPLHQYLRSWVNQFFTPRRVAALTPLVEQCVSEVLDPLLGREQLDVIGDIASPIPVTVISRLLGVPAEDRRRLQVLIEQGLCQRSPEMLRTNPLRPGLAEVRAYFQELIRMRRCTLQHDLISDLIQIEIAGNRLSDERLASLCQSLYVGGHLTTINLIGNMLLCFHAYPEAFQLVRTNPDLLAGAIEEVLRFCSPVQSFARLITHDIEVRGHVLRKCERTLLWLGSANHDERAFREPERFDIMRTPNKHLAFGHGVHFCLGTPLARLEGLVTMRMLLEKVSHMRLQQDVPLKPVLPRSFYGVERMLVTFTPRKDDPGNTQGDE